MLILYPLMNIFLEDYMKFKKRNMWILFILSIFIFVSCEDVLESLSGIDPVITTFVADKTNVYTGDSVKFTMTGTTKDDNVSSSSTDYGAILKLSTEEETLKTIEVYSSSVAYIDFNESYIHQFAQAGTYVVTLTLTPNTGSTTVSKKVTVIVTTKPVSNYTVSFESNNSKTVPLSKTVVSGNTVTLPIVTRSGYTFVAWYKESTFKTKWYSTTKVTESVKLYAKWTKNAKAGSTLGAAVSKTCSSTNYSYIDMKSMPNTYCIRAYLYKGNRMYYSKSISNEIYFSFYDTDKTPISINGSTSSELSKWTRYNYITIQKSGYYYIKLYHFSYSGLDFKFYFWQN